MKHTGTVTMILAILVLAFCLNSYAQDISAQVTALEKRAERIQSQIEQAKQASAATLEQQIKMLQGSVNSLTESRVQIDSQIASVETQIEKLKSNAQSVLNRQMDHYNQELAAVKQQISGLVSQKKTEPVANAASSPNPDAAVTSAPTPGPAAPATKPGTAGVAPGQSNAPKAPEAPQAPIDLGASQAEAKGTTTAPPAPAN